jgi:hypothetical protein
MSQEIIVINGEPILTRTALIAWNDDGEQVERTFALIPEDWKDKDLSEHPADELIFYYLDAYEWIRFSVGESNGDWTVISL